MGRHGGWPSARAILHDGPLWVLDEPTEGLDPITEKNMMQALKRQTAGRTLLLITHRLLDLDWMDHILMLDHGRVIARGSHAELLKKQRAICGLASEDSVIGNSEPQNIEYPTAEYRRIVSLCSFFFIKMIEYIPSTFDIHDSIFDIRF